MVRDAFQNASRPLRVLFLARDKFPPRRVDVEVLFGEKLVRMGHHIDWVLQSDKPATKSYFTKWRNGSAWIGSNTDRGSAMRRVLGNLSDIWNDLRVFKITRKNRYDLLLVRDKFVAAIFGLVCARVRKIRFIYWQSFPFPEAYGYTAAHKLCRYPIVNRIRSWAFHALLYWWILPRSFHIFVQSEQMKADFSRRGIAPSKLTAVPMGIALDRIPVTRSQDRNNCVLKEGPAIVYLGEIGRMRRLDFMIHVHKKVVDEVPDAKLYLVGGTEELEGITFLQNEISRLGLEGTVELIGELEREQAWEYVQAATVCVSPIPPNPIYYPSSPTKLIEYLALSKPVVANDIPDQRQVITESEGGCCVPWDIDEFAKAVVNLIRNPQEAERLARNGHRYVVRHRAYDTLAVKVEQTLLAARKEHTGEDVTVLRRSRHRANP